MINKLGLPLFIIGAIMIAFSLGRGTAGTDVKSAKDVQTSVSVVQSTIPSSTINPASSSAQSTEKFLVTKVIDGDTIDIQLNNKKETLRLIGINAPETNECFGKEATSRANSLLSSKFIALEPDPTQGERDKYNRLLRYIFVEGMSFEEFMIREGFAKEYTYNKPYKYQSLFKSAEQDAKSNKKGLWSTCTSGSNQQPTTVQPTTTQPSGNVQYQVQGSYACDCSKLCSQISTCDEAYYQLNQCSCSARDSDKDGIPCESLCR